MEFEPMLTPRVQTPFPPKLLRMTGYFSEIIYTVGQDTTPQWIVDQTALPVLNPSPSS